jgi:plastocyanin
VIEASEGRCDNLRVRRLIPVSVLIVLAACGGSPAGPNSGGAGSVTTVSILSSGVSTTRMNVSPGTRVTFINNDTRSHNMTSDPHPDHNECPEINAVGLLQPGQSRETGNLNTIRTCGFHDHDDPPPPGGTNRWTGQITIR